jgi:hypothetical protein
VVPAAAVQPRALSVIVRIFGAANPVDDHALPDAVLHLTQNVVDALSAFFGCEK